MLLNLWNYIRGYVIIEITGFSVERFINMAVHRGVYIWDLKHYNNRVIMKVSIKGFKLLKSYAKKTKCKLKITHKVGAPFFFFRYRKRKILVSGVAFFILIIYFLSSFIWLIEFEGYDRIDYNELLDFAAENGLKVGAFKHSIDKRELEQLIIFNFKEISFINIEIKGTRALIKLTEIIPETEIVDRTTPSNIIAMKDGLIESIYTSAGTPIVQAGDIVSQGDILVTGELELRNDETGVIKHYVRSIADIKARLYYTINFHVPDTRVENHYTGNKRRSIRLNIMGRNINFIPFFNKYRYYNKNTSSRQLYLGRNYPLPIIILTDTYKEYIPITIELSQKEIEELAYKIIIQKILQEFDFDVDIIDKVIEYEEVEGGLSVEALIITLENIGIDTPIEIVEPLHLTKDIIVE